MYLCIIFMFIVIRDIFRHIIRQF